MPDIEIRAFRRDDREQLSALVNAHVAAVIPGISVSVNAVMGQLERESGESIVDPWVVERRTLVAIQRDAVVAGAHLHRYANMNDVAQSYRDTGSIHWFVFGHGRDEAADTPAYGRDARRTPSLWTCCCPRHCRPKAIIPECDASAAVPPSAGSQ